MTKFNVGDLVSRKAEKISSKGWALHSGNPRGIFTVEEVSYEYENGSLTLKDLPCAWNPEYFESAELEND